MSLHSALLSEYSAKRSYTTRAKEEQRRTCATPSAVALTAVRRTHTNAHLPRGCSRRAAPGFQGRVRSWRRCWAMLGSVSVVRWVRAEKAEGLTELSFDQAASASDEGGEAPLQDVDAHYEAWRVARVKDRQQELEEYARPRGAATNQPRPSAHPHVCMPLTRPAWTSQGATGAAGTGRRRGRAERVLRHARQRLAGRVPHTDARTTVGVGAGRAGERSRRRHEAFEN